MKILFNRKIDFITIKYASGSCVHIREEDQNDYVESDILCISDKYISLERHRDLLDDELFWEATFSEGEFEPKFNKLCDLILNLGDALVAGLDGPHVEITIYFSGGDIRIERDIYGSLLVQEFNELVEVLLEILPSDWVVPKFCEI